MISQTLGSLARHGLEPPTLIGMSAVLMWSATIGLFRGVAEVFGPVGGAALIFTTAAIFALLHAGRAAFVGIPKRYLWTGGALFVSYEVALALAVGYTTTREQALEVGMINYLWPSLTIALAIALRIERADWKIIPGLCISLFGVIWVTSGEEGISVSRLIGNFAANPPAYGLALLAALVWPLYTVVTRKTSGGKSCVPLFLAMTALVLWGKFALTDQPALVFDTGGALMVLTFGLLTTLAYSAWNHGVLHGNLAIMAAASYFTPVLSVVATSLIFSLMPSQNFWIGAMIVTAGSLICWASTRGKS